MHVDILSLNLLLHDDAVQVGFTTRVQAQQEVLYEFLPQGWTMVLPCSARAISCWVDSLVLAPPFALSSICRGSTFPLGCILAACRHLSVIPQCMTPRTLRA